MKSRKTFLCSVSLNLVLLGLLAFLGRPDSRVPEARGPRASRSPAVTDAPRVSEAAIAPPFVMYLTNRFDWSRVESGDWAQLAANLRAIGCPEKTVRDLLSARARRALDAATTHPQTRVPFWTAGRDRERVNREAERKTKERRAAILERIERVLGTNGFVEDPLDDQFVDQAIVRFFSGPMSEDSFARMVVAFSHQESWRTEFRARTQGLLLPEDQAEQVQRQARLQRELRAILSPAEFEEFTARLGFMKLADDVRFEATDLNPTEIRQVALLRGGLAHTELDSWFDGDDLSEEQETGFLGDLRQLLGEARYAQFERAADDDFQRLFELTQEFALPRRAADQAFELRQLTSEEVRGLRADATLSPADRAARMTTIQTEVLGALEKVLGAKACAEYLSHGGGWVTNVSGL